MLLCVGEKERGTIEEIIHELAHQSDYPQERNYGYFTVRSRQSGQVIFILRIGKCPPERAEKCLALSQEKGRRLFETKELISSWQSRDPEQERWGGAIVTEEYILSFSGLPERADEALMLRFAQVRRLAGNEELQKIAEASNNPFLPL
jgi:hypothetical protein